MEYSNREGWLSGIYEKAVAEEFPFSLAICFPMSRSAFEEKKQSIKRMETKNVKCFAFVEDLQTPEIYDKHLEQQFQEIFEEYEPDLVHIFGTEFPHTLAAVRAFGDPGHTLIGIQGLCCEIAKCYQAGLSEEVFRSVSFRDILRRDSMKQQQKKFELRGKHEVDAIRGTGNITGRTVFDRETTQQINPHATYFSMNETMRAEFYEGKWEQDKAEPYSIFLGQGDYPLKGMHILLKAMGRLKEAYPALKLYVAGNNIISRQTGKDKIKLPAYGKYLLHLLKENELEEHVVMLGKLSAGQMKRQYLNSSVFVCASVLENSPNTVGEAMLLGVPVIAARTGGIPSMIEDGLTGFLFENRDDRELAAAITRLWENPELAQSISSHERVRASFTHDRDKNYQRLLEIYDSIL